MSDKPEIGDEPDPQRNGADPALGGGIEPGRGSGIVLMALVAAAAGASFVPGAAAGLTLASALGLTSDAAIALTGASVLVVGAAAISLGVWVAGKLTDVTRRGRRFVVTVGCGVAGLVLGLLVAAIAGSLGAIAMVMLTGIGAVLGDSLFLKRSKN